MVIENSKYIGHMKHYLGLERTVIEIMVPRGQKVYWPYYTSLWLGNDSYVEYIHW